MVVLDLNFTPPEEGNEEPEEEGNNAGQNSGTPILHQIMPQRSNREGIAKIE